MKDVRGRVVTKGGTLTRSDRRGRRGRGACAARPLPTVKPLVSVVVGVKFPLVPTDVSTKYILSPFLSRREDPGHDVTPKPQSIMGLQESDVDSYSIVVPCDYLKDNL